VGAFNAERLRITSGSEIFQASKTLNVKPHNFSRLVHPFAQVSRFELAARG
jgi:hypothetical protein